MTHQARNVLAPPGISTGGHLWDQATSGGAQPLDRRIAAVAPGHRADIIILDPAHPALAGRAGDAILDAVIFAAAPVRHRRSGCRRPRRSSRPAHRPRSDRRHLAPNGSAPDPLNLTHTSPFSVPTADARPAFSRHGRV
jgi:hypothetical protein